MFNASMGGNYQIASITALILLVPSVGFMLVIERFLRPRCWPRSAAEPDPGRLRDPAEPADGKEAASVACPVARSAIIRYGLREGREVRRRW